MKASTKDYVHLQGLYKDKANDDLRAFIECVKKTLGSVGLDEDAIAQEEISNFVKNCHWLLCIDGRSLRDENETDIQKNLIGVYTHGSGKNDIGLSTALTAGSLSDEMHMNYYLAFRACERFYVKNRRWPLSEDDRQNVLHVISPVILANIDYSADDNDLLEKAIREM